VPGEVVKKKSPSVKQKFQLKEFFEKSRQKEGNTRRKKNNMERERLKDWDSIKEHQRKVEERKGGRKKGKKKSNIEDQLPNYSGWERTKGREEKTIKDG